MTHEEAIDQIKTKLNESLNLITEALVLAERAGGRNCILAKQINKGYDIVAKAFDMVNL